ncbi:5'-nucleotidase C-terminal domain-containing protein [uncultured Microbacterium sp.]|uniref:5'-nucleotidase C-terminal domain-containing protein n=1 Tax=uncultured Microbacterium sp. TaxID=191216 RepID=UPI0028D5A55F|nr:5'-nucleotidase C-terminal domain-containing protein [uncultured Microbacterium sp.]
MRSRSATPPTRRRLALGAAAIVIALGAGAVAAPAAQAAPTQIQIIATNDFHGRILADGANAAGAAVLSGAVKQLRAANPNTVFAAAGDLIGASTFESFIQSDKPTIDALNEAGLEVSAVGNHELDQGYDDLVNRVMAPYDAVTNPYGGAQWEYIAANLKLKGTPQPAVAPSWIKEFGDVKVGFVGAVTEELPALVSPAGIAELDVAGIVQSVNAEAAALVAGGADLVVMLVHEGAPSTTCETMDDSGAWADIINNVSPDVDAIVSGHTHLAYNCSFPVAQWATEGRAVTDRPVVSAGQYGTNLNQLLFTVDGATGVVSAKSQGILPLTTGIYPPDAGVAEIVQKAKDDAEVLGAVPLGEIGGAFNRAQIPVIDPATGVATINRGGESTLGNLVAEVQQWATEAPESGAAQIAFMNPGGLRDDMRGVDDGDGSYPRTLTYRQAANVQPFANTLVNLQLTGAQIKTVLEQQWQRDALNRVPTRPFLRLGASEGFEYTYTQVPVTESPLDNPATPNVDESLTSYTAPRGTVTGMWLNDVPIDLAATYSVSVNAFLASGGDNFREFANGSNRRDTGKVDLQAMVDYMDTFASSEPLPVDYSQRAVEVSFPGGAPASYELGSTVAFSVKSWTMSTPEDVKDAELVVSLGGQTLGSFAVDNTIGTAIYDDYGTASVSVVLPADAPVGATELILTGAATGTTVTVPITTFDRADSTITGSINKATVNKKQPVQYTVRVSAEGGVPVTGEVKIYDGTKVVATETLAADDEGRVKVKLSGLTSGVHQLSASYSGSDTVRPSQSDTVQVTVK